MIVSLLEIQPRSQGFFLRKWKEGAPLDEGPTSIAQGTILLENSLTGRRPSITSEKVQHLIFSSNKSVMRSEPDLKPGLSGGNGDW